VGYGVWTLGIMRLTRYLPRLRWNPALMRDLLNYGRYVFAGAVLVFLYANLDNASIGRLLGARALGYYAFAFQLAYLPALLITGGVVSSVLMPLFAKLQTQHDAQAGALLSALRYVTYYAAPIAVATIVLGPYALHAVYGKKWAPMFTALQILAVYGFFHSYFIVVRALCNGLGRAKAFSWITGLQLAIVVPLLVPATLRFGIIGTSLLFTLAKVACVLVGALYAAHFTGLAWRRIVAPVGFPVLFSVAAGGLASLTRLLPLQHGRQALMGVALSIVVFLVAYVALCLWWDPALPAEVMRLAARRTDRRSRPMARALVARGAGSVGKGTA
jgi:O-antigen/teichoic acid export membrane protein